MKKKPIFRIETFNSRGYGTKAYIRGKYIKDISEINFRGLPGSMHIVITTLKRDKSGKFVVKDDEIVKETVQYVFGTSEAVNVWLPKKNAKKVPMPKNHQWILTGVSEGSKDVKTNP